MSDVPPVPDPVRCTLVLEWAPELHRLLVAEEAEPDSLALAGPVATELTQAVDDLLDTLGIPGKVTLELHRRPESEPGNSGIPKLRVNGARLRYSDDVVIGAHAYATDTLPAMDSTPEGVAQWLREALSNSPSASSRRPATTFLSHFVQEAIRRQPALLLGLPQTEAYRAFLAGWLEARGEVADWLPDAQELQEILRPVVELGISLADFGRVVESLSAGAEAAASPEDLAEEMIVALRPQVVEILVPSAYLRELTLEGGPEDRDVFAHLREGLHYETGLAFPDFRFVPTEGVPTRSFSFRIQHLRTLPQIGLRGSERLVDRESAHTKPILNPANLAPCSVLSAQDAEGAAEEGRTIWTPLGYLVLQLSVALREGRRTFVDRSGVGAQLSALESVFPEPVRMVRERHSLARMTRVLRNLAAGRISIRNLRRIVEAMLDFDYVVCEPGTLIVLDPRLPSRELPTDAWLHDAANIAAFVRTDMKRFISHMHTRGQASLTVFLLDPEAERIVASGVADESWQETFLQAVREESRHLTRTSQVPAVLTTVEACHALRTLLAPEFPRMPVLAYQELAQELSIHPIARIQVPDM